jgi:tRNA-binding EMAP/Myf-like protein
MSARIATVARVRRHGDNLTIVTVADGDATHEVVANLKEDGTPRWVEGEIVVYVAEGSIVPEDVLRERGYWNEAGNGGKGKGHLDGKKGNLVKMRRMADFESRGLLLKTRAGTFMGVPVSYVDRDARPPMPGEGETVFVDSSTAFGGRVGDDVTAFLGIVEKGA